MVRAIIESLFRLGVRAKHSPVFGRRRLKHIVERRVAEPDNSDVLCWAILIQSVHIYFRDCFVQRIYRILGIILRPDQSLLFGGHRYEKNRAARRFWRSLERASHFNQPRAARGVVERAVVDFVALLIRYAYAVAVPMCGVDYVLILQLRIGAFELSYDIG